MSDLLAEVDEMMRQERIMKLWQDHGGTLIAVIAAIILGTAGTSGYKAWNSSVKEKHTAQLADLLDSPDFPANINEAALDIRPGLKGIGLLTAAGSLISEEKNDEALALLATAENDKSIPDDLRELATLTAVRLQAAQDNPPENLAQRLGPVMNNDNSPWRYHAHLEAAVLVATRNQNFAEARAHLNTILDAGNLPETLYTKARALDKVYALKQYEQDKKNNNAADKDS